MPSDESLISLVRSHEFLYDKSCDGYKLPEIKKAAWASIARKLGISADKCCNRWKSLRERFTRELKQFDENKTKTQSPLFEAMYFLKEHIIMRPTRSSFNIIEDSSDATLAHLIEEIDEVDIDSPTSPTHSTFLINGRKRKAKVDASDAKKKCRNEALLLKLRSDEKLIILVSQHEVLYNKSCVVYNRKENDETAWSHIANELGASAESCAKRWKILRERFSRELKQVENASASDSTYSTNWPLFEAMSFLRDYIKPRNSRPSLNVLNSWGSSEAHLIQELEEIDIDEERISTMHYVEHTQKATTESDDERVSNWRTLFNEAVRSKCRLDKQLINLVRQHESLFNKYCLNFKGPLYKKAEWMYIADKLETTAELCFRRWKSLRERFTKELRLIDIAEENGNTYATTWPLFEDMYFLKEHIKQRSTLSSPILISESPNNSKQSMCTDEELIALVKCHEILFNKSCTSSKTKEAVWLLIAKKLGTSAMCAERRWKTLRDRYVKELKQGDETFDSVVSSTRNWPLFDQLSFLKSHVKPRNYRSSFSILEDSTDSTQAQELPEIDEHQLTYPVESSPVCWEHNPEAKYETDSGLCFTKTSVEVCQYPFKTRSDENLIALVRRHKVLYNKTWFGVKGSKEKKDAWSSIAKEFGTTEEKCFKRWKALRERFAREIKLVNETSSSSVLSNSQWPLYSAMSFLKKYIVPRQSRTLMDFSESIEEVHLVEEINEIEEEHTMDLMTEPFVNIQKLSNHNSNDTRKSYKNVCNKKSGNRSHSKDVGVELRSDRKLISLVRQHDVLFKRTSRGSRYLKIKYNKWSSIANELGTTARICYKRWKLLVDRFFKECMVMKESGTLTKSHWPLYKDMSFMKKDIEPQYSEDSKDSTHAIIIDDFEEIADESPMSSIPSPSAVSGRKQKVIEYNDTHIRKALWAYQEVCQDRLSKKNNNQAVHGFEEMIISTIAEMSEVKQAKAIMRVTEIIMTIKMEP